MITKLSSQSRESVEWLSKSPRLRNQSLVVALAGLAFGLQHAGNYFVLDDAADHVSSVLWARPALSIVTAFLVWVGGTTGMYLVSRFLPERFYLGRLLKATGWGLCPLIVAGFLQSAGRLYALTDAEPPEEPLRSGIEYENEVYQPYIDQAASDPIFVVATLLGIPFVLVSAYMWTVAVESLSSLGRRHAIYMAAVPTIVTLYWLLSPLL